MMKKLILPTILVVLLGAPFAWAALQTWDSGTFEASPANSDPVSQGDDKIRELKENIRERGEVEHLWGTISTGGDNGRSREGNARVFYDNSEPSALSNSVTDTAGSGALDEGRLWRDADDGDLKVYNGSAWVQAFTTLRGTINFLGTPQFATTAGADAFNPLAFTIRAISTDLTQDTTACNFSAAVNSTAIASQVFGNAGDACYFITVDYSTRSTTSRGVIVAAINVSGAGTTQLGVYRDAMANQLGAVPIVSVGGNEWITTTAYVTGVTAATHEFALHVSDSLAGGSQFANTTDPNGGYLIYIDLGPEY